MPNVNLTDVVNVDAVMGVEGAAWALFAALLGVGLLTVRMYSVQRCNSFILTLLKNVFFFPCYRIGLRLPSPLRHVYQSLLIHQPGVCIPPWTSLYTQIYIYIFNFIINRKKKIHTHGWLTTFNESSLFASVLTLRHRFS